MGTKKDLGIVLFIYAIFVSMLLISPIMAAGSDVDCEVVTRVFQSTGAKFAKLQVNGWIKINSSEIANELAGSNLHNRMQRLLRSGFAGTVKAGYDGQSPIQVVEGNINSDIYVKIVLKTVSEGNKTANRSTYLIASVTTQNKAYNLADLNQYLSLIIPEKDIHRSITMTGIFPGKISPPLVNEIIQKMVSITRAQNVERMEIGQLVSITGYTPDVRQLTWGKKSVNINIAVRYNSVENRTFLYVGSPTITNEY